MVTTVNKVKNVLQDEVNMCLRKSIIKSLNDIESEKDLRVIYAFVKAFHKK